MAKTIKINNALVGEGHPVFIIAEIGINHNGDIEIAKRLIDLAALSGCDAVKFQKREPEICVPPDQRNIMRETPWGMMTYLDYKKKIEFGKKEYKVIDRYCKRKKISWFASCWDEPSVDFIEEFDPACHKIASACLTDDGLLKKIRRTGKPVMLSTGMSTMDQIRRAVEILDKKKLLIMQANSSYPCKPHELNLRVIPALKKEFDVPIGYSGHEVGLQTTYAAVVLGACAVERHITLDRAMWGTDHAASVEGTGFIRLVRDIRAIESAMGDGIKRVYESELSVMKKLRRVNS